MEAIRRTVRCTTPIAALALAAGLVASAGPAGAADEPTRPNRGTPPPATTSAGTPVDLDALFVGAHPDDEASLLSTLGQWEQSDDVSAGVITVTRGEGGGNAVGPEEGPALGLLREAEERRAVARGGVENVYNLDEVDFYYTVSAPLTEQIWGHDDLLERVVRVVRETRPEVLMTMNPAPSPGQHGNHQYAARMAIEAFYAAADPTAFPEQITAEGLEPWSAGRVLTAAYTGAQTTGPACAATVQPADPAQTAYGIWGGAASPDGTTWAQVEREAQREYVSQGWAGFPDVAADPAALGCDHLTQVDSRVPSAEPGTATAAAPDAVLQGALVRADGAVPLGTQLEVDAADARVVQGASTSVSVRVAATEALGGSAVALDLPAGWTATGSGDLGDVPAGGSAEATFTVQAPADAEPGTRVRLAADLTTAAGTGWAAAEVEVDAPVRGDVEVLPQVEEFRAWTRATGVPQLQGAVRPVLSMPSGGTRDVDVVVTNGSDQTWSGAVTIELPEGFSATEASLPFADLAAGATTTVTFAVTNGDASLPTSNQGGTAGDYGYTLTTTTDDGASSTTTPALELVPTTTIPQAPAAPVVDGVEAPGEYPGEELDLSRLWEGTPCTSATDCSATGRLTWHDDALSVLVQVQDDVVGTPLDAADCKRHWRTDSVEIALDPRGTSENTSTTFKGFVLPVTAEGGPCAGRDADNRQGPAEQTAPGMQVASTTRPGTGWTVEATIPLALLPAAVDPERLGVDLFVYDSDTQDRTGQTRIGWSTWQGVQGDPYRWGVATMPGYAPPADRPVEPAEPVIPTVALDSLDSPQSIAQAVADDVPLAGGPAAPARGSAWLTGAVQRRDDVVASVRAGGPGRLHLSVWDDAAQRVVATRTVDVERSGPSRWWVPLPDDAGDVSGTRVLAGFEAAAGGTLASVADVP